MNTEISIGIEDYIPIAKLEPNQIYNQVFLVSHIIANDSMQTQQRQYFAKVTLKDVTGEITGVVWNYKNDLKPGQYVYMEIETQVYRDYLEFQAKGSSIRHEDVPLNQYDYEKGVSQTILMSYAGEVQESITSIDDPVYRNIMGNAIERLDLMHALMNSPYGITGPMAYKGGLLVHVTHSLRLAKVAINQSKELQIPFSSSLVIAGCTLRNIGWHTTTLFQGDHLRPRDAYHMIGIHRASARYIDHLMLSTESDLQIQVPESKRQALENMCNKRPDIMTLEGKIVSCADNMADVLDFSVASLQKKTKGSWTDELFTGHL